MHILAGDDTDIFSDTDDLDTIEKIDERLRIYAEMRAYANDWIPRIFLSRSPPQNTIESRLKERRI